MFEWYNTLVVESFKSNHFLYGMIVVLTMVITGTIIGLLADFLLGFTGLKFDEYTDCHH